MAKRIQRVQAPQAQQIPPLEQYYNPLFWTYFHYDHQKQQVADNWLHHNNKEVTQLQLGIQFIESVKSLSHQIGSQIHPNLLMNNDNFSQDQEAIQYLTFNFVKVDWLTLKLIQFFQHQENLQVLHFKDNLFHPDELIQLYNIVSAKETKVIKLFIENNPLTTMDEQNNHQKQESNHHSPSLQDKHHAQNIITKDFFIQLGLLTNLEFLVLKGNQLDDEFFTGFFKNVKNHPNNQLKYLDFGKNLMTKIGFDEIVRFLEGKNSLVYLGISQNNLGSHKDIKTLYHSIGRHKIPNDEMIKIQELEVQREAMIQKYTKQKKKFTDEMLPQIPHYLTTDGHNFIIHNSQFQVLNLGGNSFNDHDREFFEKLLAIQNETFVLNLEYNNFEESTKLKMKKKFKNNIIV